MLLAMVAAAFAGGLLWGRLAVAKERWRRIFRDWKTGRKAQRTLRRMLRRVTGQVVQAAAVLLVVAAVAVYLIGRAMS